jgi:peptidoglycan/xylan/chitin deacetylase (PgdA/CDA1 family)
MNILKTISRKFAYPIINKLKLDLLYSKFNQNSNMVLCLHGVTDKPNFKINNRHMPIQEFEKLIVYLKNNYNIIDLETAFKNKINKVKGKRKQICLTFDDGYLNNFEIALPILEKHKVPATFYLISRELIEDDYMMWTDLVDFVSNCEIKKDIKHNDAIFKWNGSQYFCPTFNLDLSNYFKTLGHEKNELIDFLKKEFLDIESIKQELPYHWRFINKSEILKYANSQYIQLGSHTENHHNLSNIDISLTQSELVDSKLLFENMLKKPMLSIAYPDGSYNEKVKDEAEKAGYKYQLAVNYQCKDDKADNRILNRLSISNSTTFESNIFRINTSFSKYGF